MPLLQKFMLFLKTQDDRSFIESMITCFAAPVLSGLKCGVLLNLCRQGKDLRACWANAKKPLEESLSVEFAEISSKESSVLLLIYRKAPLLEALSAAGAKEILLGLGYADGFDSAELYLKEMISRFNGGIPHEIGLFLGYPPEDVLGFIENEGKNSKLSGYWKVYGDEIGALKKFKEYKKAEADSAGAMLEKAGYVRGAAVA
jgi:hypothetical protein